MILGGHYVRYDTLFHKCVMNRNADKQGRGVEMSFCRKNAATYRIVS